MKSIRRDWTRILDVAALNNAEVVILGAFGCGAFQNKPEVVARAAKEVITDYLQVLKPLSLLYIVRLVMIRISGYLRECWE